MYFGNNPNEEASSNPIVTNEPSEEDEDSDYYEELHEVYQEKMEDFDDVHNKKFILVLSCKNPDRIDAILEEKGPHESIQDIIVMRLSKIIWLELSVKPKTNQSELLKSILSSPNLEIRAIQARIFLGKGQEEELPKDFDSKMSKINRKKRFDAIKDGKKVLFLYQKLCEWLLEVDCQDSFDRESEADHSNIYEEMKEDFLDDQEDQIILNELIKANGEVNYAESFSEDIEGSLANSETNISYESDQIQYDSSC